MRKPFWQALAEPLAHRMLARAPAVWGKLSTQGDFVHHRADVAERQAWQDWVESVWSLCARPAPSDLRSRRQARGWISLDAPQRQARVQQLPIAFVMPAGMVAMQPGWMVQGVAVPSCDKVGRSCPFIIYQHVRPAWAARLWHQPPQAHGQTLLFWWARLAWLAVQGHRAWPQWLDLLDAVWAVHRPGLAQCCGAPPHGVPEAAMQALLGPMPEDDPAHAVHGVYHLPWADWPQRSVRHQQPMAAFWTQDAQGGYVHAGSHLMHLWGQP